MKKTTLIARILIILLVFVLIASLILPAFAATASDDSFEPNASTPAEGYPTDGSVSEQLTYLFHSNMPAFLLFAATLFTLSYFLSAFLVKSVVILVYRSRAKKLADQHFAHVKLTGIPEKDIISHFAQFTVYGREIKVMERHFLEELYAFFMATKSEELAMRDESGAKDKEHIAIRAEVYRNLLEKNYSYQDFLDLLPLDPDTARLL